MRRPDSPMTVNFFPSWMIIARDSIAKGAQCQAYRAWAIAQLDHRPREHTKTGTPDTRCGALTAAEFPVRTVLSLPWLSLTQQLHGFATDSERIVWLAREEGAAEVAECQVAMAP